MLMEPPSSPQSIEELSSLPFLCLNCDTSIGEAKLFCSDICKDEAKFVRYFRARLKDGRYDQPDVQEALRIRLAHILGGGYSERARRLPQNIRDAVIKRDKGKCQKCGDTGSQIDHIKASSSDLTNLQLLCSRCHNEKTKSGFVTISKETHPEEWKKREALLARVHASCTSRLCDSEEWKMLWRPLLKARKDRLKTG